MDDLDVLVNVAGIGSTTNAPETTLDVWENVFAVNGKTGEVICGVTVSLDGFVAGEGMTEQRPFGDVDPVQLHRWQFEEREKHAAVHARVSSFPEVRYSPVIAERSAWMEKNSGM